jgi:hypothetical protein
MSVRCVPFDSSRLRVIALAAGVLYSVSSTAVLAEGAGTAGGANAGTEASGSGHVSAHESTSAESSGAQGVDSANAQTTSSGHTGGRAGSHHNGSSVNIGVFAHAGARSSEKGVSSDASAGVEAMAGATQGGDLVSVATNNHGATAASSGWKGYSAYATSGAGASAYAKSGKHGALQASINGGTVNSYQQGKMHYVVASTSTGTFSAAVSTRRYVTAYAGSTSNAQALASGNLQAILASGVYVQSYASRTNTWSYSAAWAQGGANNASNGVNGGANAWAFASATRKIDAAETRSLKISVVACGSNPWPVKRVKLCRVKRNFAKLHQPGGYQDKRSVSSLVKNGRRALSKVGG